MDWTIVYQVTVFLAIALLAVVVTIFVLASSLLGLAVESASKEEEDRRTEQFNSIKEQVLQYTKALEQAQDAGTGELEAERIQEKLKELVAQQTKFQKETKSILRGYEVFRPKGGVLYPSIPIFVSLVFSAIAWGLGTGIYQSVSPFLWGVGVAALGFGLYRIYFGLKRIERVAVTSEQAALVRMTRALGTALEKHDEVMKPRLALKFLDKEPPFHVSKKSTLETRYTIELEQGNSLQRADIWFIAPPDFSFPDKNAGRVAAELIEQGFGCACCDEFKDIIPKMVYYGTFKLGTPAQTGTFRLGYAMRYEGGRGALQDFEVVVE